MKSLCGLLLLLTLLATAAVADSVDGLFDAVRTGQADRVVSMLAANPQLVNAHDSEVGATALHIAVSVDNPRMVRILLEHGAEVNAGNIYKQTALHLCAQFDNVPLARMLLARGANVNARTKFDVTPLRLAVANKNRKIADFLRQNGGSE